MQFTISRYRIAGLVGGLLLAGAAQAALTVIDFEAVAFRGANADGSLPLITEYSNGNGATTSSLVAGQKAYYGTNHFGGATVSSIDTISFTYKPSANGLPYLNLAITNGTTIGILALGEATTSTPLGGGIVRATYDISSAFLSGFYERVGPDPLFGSLDYSDIDDWTLLTGPRPTSATEVNAYGQPRGPVDHALTIVWGDSANNYLGAKEIYDVLITDAQGNQFVAGIPEPASLALLGIGLLGLAGWRRART